MVHRTTAWPGTSSTIGLPDRTFFFALLVIEVANQASRIVDQDVRNSGRGLHEHLID
jgi:hypothetical protein